VKKPRHGIRSPPVCQRNASLAGLSCRSCDGVDVLERTRRSPHVALSLAELDFIDSPDLSVLVPEHKRTESMGGELIIFSPRPRVRKVFEATGLDEYFNIRPTKAIPTRAALSG
jgi:anti-anti-sigma regulatory factor